MTKLHKQRGLSTAGWLLAVGLAGFFLTLLFKMGPAYLNNMGVRSAMKSMVKNNSDFHNMERDEIYKQLDSYFTINGVRDHRAKDMKIVRTQERTLINHEYETRVPVFLNVDVVMKFRNQVDSTNLDACCAYLVETEDGKRSN